MSRNLDHLKQRAWDELAVGTKGFMNIQIGSKTIEESAKQGFTTPKQPMKDLSDSITQAVFEELDPDIAKIPDFDHPIRFTFTGNHSLTIPHGLGKIPKGYIITYTSAPVIIYITDRDISWNNLTITLSSYFPTDQNGNPVASSAIVEVVVV